MHSSTLSRTSSAASISSDDAARRTRRRFTSVQLVLLEQLFHQSSHPTRQERETVARAAGMETKSVTIWFQNRRQTERKIALHIATNQPADAHRTASFSIPSSSPSTLSSPYASTSTSASHPIRTHTRTLSNSHSYSTLVHTPRRKVTPPRPRPSLDRVATRSESRLPPPRTPTRPHDPHASLWDNMPSSPLAPPASPPSRDLIEFMGSRTLEWACAAARLAGKERRRPRERDLDRDHDGDSVRVRGESEPGGAGDDTEEDDVEAVTPEGSLGASEGARWQGQSAHVRPRPRLAVMPVPDESLPGSASMEGGKWPAGDTPSKDAPQDDDMMRAALALCGLGRRSG